MVSTNTVKITVLRGGMGGVGWRVGLGGKDGMDNPFPVAALAPCCYLSVPFNQENIIPRKKKNEGRAKFWDSHCQFVPECSRG